MKQIRYIAYTALCSLLLAVTGCQKEEPTKQSDSSTFTIQIAGEGSSSVLTRAEVVENVTTPLHLLIYKAGAAVDEAPVFYQKDTLTDATTKKIKCKLPANLTVTDKYDVYVVGSAGADAIGISDKTIKSQLLALIQTGIADITSKTKPYMLAGVTLSVALDPSPTVKIVRNVCRLDLKLTDNSGNNYTTIEATLSAPDRTFLFSSALRGTGLENSFPADTKDTEQVLNLTDANKFTGSLFFFEKMTTADGVKTEADRVKLSIKATNASSVVFQYVIYLNADDNYTTTRNTIYQVDGTMKDGTIIIKTEKLPWSEVVQGEEKPDPIVIQPKANTYLVTPSSNAILIPVAQANDAAIPGIAIAANEALTAELVWTDVKGVTSGKGLALDAAVAAIEVIGTGPDALLMVTPGSQLGNAVIAVKSGNVIKWSWHIWVTDYDPEQETGQNTSGGYIFMDRNLGAKSILPTTTGENIIGNYYQFGRKDPFPTKSNTEGFVPTYKADGTAVVQTTGNTTSAENQIKNPYLWGSATGYPADLELWGEKGKKTVNDPCPSGWRVPSSNAYVDLTTHILPAVTGGRQGEFTGFYPYTWSKSAAGAFATTQAVINWTSTSTAATTGLTLNCNTTTTVAGNTASVRANGHAVRCVRDLRNEKHEKEVRIFTAGFLSVSRANYLGKAAPVYPTLWQEGLVPLLNTNFGPGKPVDAFFKHYSYYNGGYAKVGTDYDFIDLLTTHDIDVLFLPWNESGGTPSLTQAQGILDWLDADPHRVLFACFDYANGLRYMQNALGLYKISASQTYEYATLSNKSDNDVYNNLVTDGKYGKVTNSSFKCTYDWGYFNKDEIEANGFLPILQYVRNQNEIVMAVNPTRRVFLFCDSAPFYAVTDGSRALNLNGSLSTTGSGDYPILMANTWAWIVEAVKGR